MDHAPPDPPVPRPRAPRKAVRVTVDAAVLDEARALGLDLSMIAESALREAARDARIERWRGDNGAALESWNGWLERHGEPFDDLRPW